MPETQTATQTDRNGTADPSPEAAKLQQEHDARFNADQDRVPDPGEMNDPFMQALDTAPKIGDPADGERETAPTDRGEFSEDMHASGRWDKRDEPETHPALADPTKPGQDHSVRTGESQQGEQISEADRAFMDRFGIKPEDGVNVEAQRDRFVQDFQRTLQQTFAGQPPQAPQAPQQPYQQPGQAYAPPAPPPAYQPAATPAPQQPTPQTPEARQRVVDALVDVSGEENRAYIEQFIPQVQPQVQPQYPQQEAPIDPLRHPELNQLISKAIEPYKDVLEPLVGQDGKRSFVHENNLRHIFTAADLFYRAKENEGHPLTAEQALDVAIHGLYGPVIAKFQHASARREARQELEGKVVKRHAMTDVAGQGPGRARNPQGGGDRFADAIDAFQERQSGDNFTPFGMG